MDLVIRAFRIPLRMEFRRVTERVGVLIQGPSGWGEFSAFPDYPPEVARRWLDAGLEAAQGTWPTPLRTEIPVNVTVPAVGPEQAHRIVATSGCSTAKVKVAHGDDEARVEAVRAALGPDGRLRIDANGGWSLAEAQKMLGILARFDLEYVEQPVAQTDELAALRKRVDVPIAADESVRTTESREELARLEAADIIVLKVQPLGGVRRALEIAEKLGLPSVVSSAVETSIGIAAGAALAASLPDLPYACGLGTVPLLAGDVTRDSLVPVDGKLAVRRPEVDDEALGEWEIRIEELPSTLARCLPVAGKGAAT